MQTIYLNKKKVDFEEGSVTRKLQIGDIGDIVSRKSNHSYSIKLPLTARNKEVFDFLGVTGNMSRKPFEFVVADYFVEGVPLVSNGYAVVLGASGLYEVNIFDGIISLSEVLKGKKISDLPLSDLNHYLTSQAYIDSLSNKEGYIYALGSFGLDKGGNMKIENQAPSIFSRTLVKKIFKSNGIYVEGGFFDTNKDFAEEVLTPVNGYEVLNDSLVNISKGGFSVKDFSVEEKSDSNFLYEKQVGVVDSVDGAYVSGLDLVFMKEGVYKFNLFFKCVVNLGYSGVDILVNGVNIYHAGVEEGDSFYKGEFIINIKKWDRIKVKSWSSSGLSSLNGVYSVDFSLSNFLVDVSLQKGGQLIESSKFVGDLSQLEFLKDITKRYGLVIKPLSDIKGYEFKQLEVILQDVENAENWSDKLKNGISEKYSSGYAKVNTAKYKYSKEIKFPNNDGEMLIDNENALDSKVLFSSVFEIPEVVDRWGGVDVYNVPIWKLNKDNEKELSKTTPKVMKIRRFNLPYEIKMKLFDEVNGIGVQVGVPFLSLDKMSMQYYVDNNYKSFRSLMNSYKEVTCSVNLSVIDVFNLDFFKLKYLKQTGRYYYLDSVVNTVGKLSKVKMVEISEFLKNKPPSIGSYTFNFGRTFGGEISSDVMLSSYVDIELDKIYKVKIISGFNSDIVLYQNGVEIKSEMEVIASDLNLSYKDLKSGHESYSRKWLFAVSDLGSKKYGEPSYLIGNVAKFVNIAPVANAGDDKTVRIMGLNTGGAVVTESVFLDGSGSVDLTGEMSYYWTCEEHPAGTDITIISSGSNASFKLIHRAEYLGTYIFRLLVKDNFGLSNYDEVTIKVVKY